MGTYLELTQNLADAFNTLADEAQGLNDRRIVLEHKLRFAHEQVSRYAFSLPVPPKDPPFCVLRCRPRTSIINLPGTEPVRLAYITAIDG